jgi:ribosomal protein S20
VPTQPYDWTESRSKTGTVKAVGTGEHAGQNLYGAKAEAALRGRQKKQEQATGGQRQAGPAVAPGGGQSGADPGAAGRRVAEKAIADPASLSTADLQELARHLNTLPVSQLKEFARKVREKASLPKMQLAERLYRAAVNQKWKQVSGEIVEETTQAVAKAEGLFREARSQLRVANGEFDLAVKAFREIQDQSPVDKAALATARAEMERRRDRAVEKIKRVEQLSQATRQTFQDLMKQHLRDPARLNVRTDSGQYVSAVQNGTASPIGELMPEQKSAIDKAHAFVSSVCNLPDQQLYYSLVLAKDGRAFASNEISYGPAAIAAGSDFEGPSPDSYIKTHIHEMGHLIEFRKPGVLDAAKEFLKKRLGDEKPRPMREVTGINAYTPDEMGAKDSFDRAFRESEAYYIGKDYGGFATELISMGLEKLYQDPGSLAVSDPEYFKFMVEVLLK